MQMFFTPEGKAVMYLTNTMYGSKSSVAPPLNLKRTWDDKPLFTTFSLDTKLTFSIFQYSEHFTAQLRERMCTFENVQL